jgi:uncharacterized protein involved in exopolysaccharide biosynthesis
MSTVSPTLNSTLEASLDSGKSLKEWIETFKRRKWSLIITAVIISVIVAVVAYFLPAKYRSTATILIERQEIPQDFVRSPITSFADQRLQIIQQRVMTSANLFKVIDKFDLYNELRETQPREVVLDKMRNAISLDFISADVIDPASGRPTEATIAFSISFEHESPDLSLKVANEIYGLFLNENIKQRTETVRETTKFLENEATKLEQNITDLEQQLAEFKTGNVENLPELVTMNISMIDRTSQQIASIDQQLRSLRERRIFLDTQLAQTDPNSALYNTQGERLLSDNDRLKILRTELSQISGIYSANHPDILRLKREIAALEAEAGNDNELSSLKLELKTLEQQLQEAQARYSDQHPDVKSLKRAIDSVKQEITQRGNKPSREVKQVTDATNPAYTQLITQLKAVNSEISSLNISRSALQNKILELEQRLLNSPEVERKFRALNREYLTMQAKYADVKAKLSEAKISEALEIGNQGEKFTLIEPPLFPNKPVSPNRPLIMVLGILFGLSLGVALALLRETLDGAVYGRAEVLSITSMIPLAVLPTISTKKELAKRRAVKWLILLIACLSVLVLLAAIHFYYIPLDVLFYKILRKV